MNAACRDVSRLNRTRYHNATTPSRQPIFLPAERVLGLYEMGSSNTRAPVFATYAVISISNSKRRARSRIDRMRSVRASL